MVPLRLLLWRLKYRSSVNWLISKGISPSKKLSPMSNKVSLDRFPMAEVIGPLRVLLLRLKTVRLRNGVKLNWVSVPVTLKLDRSILVAVLVVVSQTMAVQLQRLLRLVEDHEFRRRW